MLTVSAQAGRPRADTAGSLLSGLMHAPGTARHAGATACLASLDLPRLEGMLALAGWHSVTPALWAALGASRSALPPDIAAGLEAAYHLNLRRNERILAQSAEIASVAAASGIVPVFLKGTAHLLAGLHPDPGARFVGDIDLLVPADRLEAAAAALAAAGYRRLPDRVAHAHDPLRLVRGDRPALVELHQAPLAFPLAPVLSADALIRRAVPAPGLPAARIPCPDDRAVHAVAHAMLQDHHFGLAELPLRDALDLRHLSEQRAGPIDWPTVADRVASVLHGRDAFAFCLHAAREAVGAETLPRPALSPAAQRHLLAWRARDGRPATPMASGAYFLRVYAGDCLWRLRNAPAERNRLVRRALSPRAYPALLRALATVAREGPLASRAVPRSGVVTDTIALRLGDSLMLAPEGDGQPLFVLSAAGQALWNLGGEAETIAAIRATCNVALSGARLPRSRSLRPRAVLPPVSRRRVYTLAGPPIEVRFAARAVETLVAPRFDWSHRPGLAPVATLTLARTRRGFVLREDRRPDVLAADAVAMSGLFTRRFAELSHGTDDWLAVLHAAAVADARGAIVLPGPNGTGKSTLTAALVARGFAYLSDDCVPIDGRGLVMPMPFALCHKARTAPGAPSACATSRRRPRDRSRPNRGSSSSRAFGPTPARRPAA